MNEKTENKPDTLTTIVRGIEILAKDFKGTPLPVTYANNAQAEKKAAALGAGWTVIKFWNSRPFYVGKEAA